MISPNSAGSACCGTAEEVQPRLRRECPARVPVRRVVRWATLCIGIAATWTATAQTTLRISVHPDGTQGNDDSFSPSVSGDGRHVAFGSVADNLVPGDTNRVSDIFTYDRQSARLVRQSVGPLGVEARLKSVFCVISADGRFVAFSSQAYNLVPDDTNERWDIFIRDRDPDENGVFDEGNGVTSRVSVSSTGEQANGDSGSGPVPGVGLTPDGRFVVFASFASNLVSDDRNERADVFVHDRLTRVTERVSVGTHGAEGNGHSGSYHHVRTSYMRPGFAVSADGLIVAFQSEATNFAPGRTSGPPRMYVHNRATRVTRQIDYNPAPVGPEKPEYGPSYYPAMSDDGRYVAYVSAVANLVPGDTNNLRDVFVYDRSSQTTTRVSVDSSGTQGNSHSTMPALSADGRWVAFNSRATNLVGGDTNRMPDVFLHDRATGLTSRVSVGWRGKQSDYLSYAATLSADGRYVAFDSSATNLVPGDTNGAMDAFIRDRGPCFAFLSCDANGDGVIDAADIDPFFLALGDPESYARQYPGMDALCAADVNRDGAANGADIDRFFECLVR